MSALLSAKIFDFMINFSTSNICFIFIRWSPLTVWPCEALVRHNKGLFKAIEKQNTAVPGDAHHARFYVSPTINNFL